MYSPNLRDAEAANCRFCSLLRGSEDVFDSTWLAEDGYKAMVSVGALVPGWTLICPVDHDVNLGTHYSRDDFWEFASRVAAVVDGCYGSVALFEHGADRSTSLTGCGVGHAHCHIVPLRFSLEVEARQVAPQLDWQHCRAIDVEAIAGGMEYLFVAASFHGRETRGSLCLLDVPVSQFFRRVVANRLGIGDLYDYKKYPMLEIARASSSDLRDRASAAVAKV